MSAPLVRHGWEIAFQPQLFAAQYNELKAEVRRLKLELDAQSFGQHPRVKLLAAVMAGIKEQIARDPYASRFALSGPLRRYGQLKGLEDCPIAIASSFGPLRPRGENYC